MEITLSELKLKKIISQAAEIGVANYVKNSNPKHDLITQNDAYKRYTQVRVDGWVDKGKVHKMRLGPAKNSKIGFSLAELMAAFVAEDISCAIYNK